MRAATVTSTVPLQISIPGVTGPGTVPATLIQPTASVSIGDRVWAEQVAGSGLWLVLNGGQPQGYTWGYGTSLPVGDPGLVRFYLRTNTGDVYYWTGASWVLVANLQGVSPTGSIVLWCGNPEFAPTGWLNCNGQAVSRTTYSALFAILGSSWGAGDGSTTFNVPDMRGRVPVGYLSSDTDFAAVGRTGGTKTHTHPLSDAGQAAILLAASSPQIVMRRITSPSWTATHGSVSGNAATNTTGQSVGAALTGNTDGGSTVQPYATVAFLIKT